MKKPRDVRGSQDGRLPGHLGARRRRAARSRDALPGRRSGGRWAPLTSMGIFKFLKYISPERPLPSPEKPLPQAQRNHYQAQRNHYQAQRNQQRSGRDAGPAARLVSPRNAAAPSPENSQLAQTTHGVPRLPQQFSVQAVSVRGLERQHSGRLPAPRRCWGSGQAVWGSRLVGAAAFRAPKGARMLLVLLVCADGRLVCAEMTAWSVRDVRINHFFQSSWAT